MDSAQKRQRNLAVCLMMLLTACAHTPPPPQTAEISAQAPATPSELEATRQQVSKLQDRIQDLETRLSALNDKINLENGGPSASAAANSKLPTENVEVSPAHGKVIPPHRPTNGKATPAVAETERSEGSASSHEAVDRFREAKILYDTKRYSDSVLEFAEFVKNESDHALAPAAQFYVGMSYYKQNEYKLAEEELSRGLLAYARSNYVPDTLLALYEVSGALKKTAKVSYYREKLIINFPNSPQAKKLSATNAPVSETDVSSSAHSKVNETSGEAAGAHPTEKTTDNASAKATEKTTDKVADQPLDKSASKSSERPSESKLEMPGEKITPKEIEKSAEKRIEDARQSALEKTPITAPINAPTPAQTYEPVTVEASAPVKKKAAPVRLTRGSNPVPFEEYTPTLEQEKLMDSAEEPTVVTKPELPGVVVPKVQGNNE